MLQLITRAILIGAFAVTLAVTPLSSILASADRIHETVLVGEDENGSRSRVRVVVHDMTGLVRLITPSAEIASTPTAIVVTWVGGCGDYLTRLTMTRERGGYVIHEATARMGCPISIGYMRSVALHLRAGIDPAKVRACTAVEPDPGCVAVHQGRRPNGVTR